MVNEILLGVIIFTTSYIVSVTFTSVFYHRALCHGALSLTPWLERFILRFGYFITAIDPMIWICTHRMHHVYSDKENDPHSPVNCPSLFKMNSAHLKYYALLNHEFRMDNSSYLSYIKDLNISLHPLMKLPNIPFLPYSLGNIIVYGLHILLYVLIYIQTGSLIYPLALAAGLLGHPIQGIFVNYFGHIGNRFGGYRNFETDDQSCNNPIVALCIFGEGYQNNHHHDSSAVNFAMAKGEFDFGYQVCRLLRFFKLAHF